MSWTRTIAVSALALGIIAVGASTASQAENPNAGKDDNTIRVRTAAVAEAPDHREVILHGVTRAADRAELSFTVGGRLTSRTVEIGDRVQAGDVLAQIDAGPYNNGYRAAAASVADLQGRLAQVERDRARMEKLGQTNSVSDSELERTRTQEASLRASVSAAQANAREASRQRRETALIAPFDGAVTAVYLEPGEATAAGRPIVQLTGAGGMEVALEVPERIWVGLRAGVDVRADLPALELVVPGKVSQIGRNSGVGGLFPIVVSIEAEQPAAGLTARVTLPVPVHEDLAVPVRAIVDPTGAGAVVYRITGGIAEAVPVQTGTLLGNEVAITGELRADDEIVVAGLGRLLDGDVVDVMR